MKFSGQQIANEMKRLGLVPLFTCEDIGLGADVIEAAYRGGIRVFEFTNRRKNSFEVFSAMVKQFGKYPDLMLGIGTVMDGNTTKKFIDAGAHFIISPILKLEMADVCRQHNIAWLPGCATLTEIVTAKENGAAVIKVFPGSVLGPGFVSSIMPVVPDLQLMITGGVEPKRENLSSWFKAGAMCVGMGSQLFTKDILEAKDWKLLEQRMTESLQMIAEIRSN
jgi:2-dehydro-3-deoxyphosphogluconate aldolase / (4S)-4-hydroxy-2-oxoglutarate aldolase